VASSYETNKSIIADEFRKAGYSEVAISGWLGRTTRESSFNPNARRKNDAGPGKDSYGIMQWNRERLEALKAFAAERGKPVSDLRTQAQFAVHETQTTHKNIGERFKNAKTVKDAVDAAMMYENPRGASKRVNGKTVWTPEQGMHYKETMEAANKFAGKKYTNLKPGEDPINAMRMLADSNTAESANLDQQSKDVVDQAAVNPEAGDIMSPEAIAKLAAAFLPKSTTTTPAKAPAPGIAEMQQLFSPRLQWAGL